MNDIQRFHRAHSFDKLTKQPESLKFGESGVPLDIISKIAPFAKLEEDIKIGFGFLNVDKIDDILMLAFF